MKKYLLVYLIIVVFSVVYLFIDDRRGFGPLMEKQGFVTLADGEFRLDGEKFFPIALNYMVSMNVSGDEIWPSPSHNYDFHRKYNYFNPNEALKHIKADFINIKNCGFNTLRIVGIGETFVEDEFRSIISARLFTAPAADSLIRLDSEKRYSSYLNGLNQILKIADEIGLKVILLNNVIPESKTAEQHFVTIAKEFREMKSLMAYDLFNEPLYFDSLDRSKHDVSRITQGWMKLARKHCPYQMITIGLEGVREILKWDPNVVEADFLSFHPYEYEPDQVRNAIYWYGKYVDKPWIIGETSIPADNDSVPYSDQVEFLRKVYKQSIDCGAIGFSWWQYKDVRWDEFHASYMGIINYHGETEISETGTRMDGGMKPVAMEFKTISSIKGTGSCYLPANYYNHTDNRGFLLTGKVVDSEGKPIEGAVIVGWDDPWLNLFHTKTQADGTFMMKSSFPVVHVRVSATRFSVLSLDFESSKAKPNTEGIPTLETGIWELVHLGFK